MDQVTEELPLTHHQFTNRDQLIENVLILTIIAHAVGMIFMLLFLLPGVPGGSQPDPAMRIAYCANHPWLWRLGWLPWQITALSDLLLSIALLRSKSVPKLPAVLGLIFTIAAILPDQIGQFAWTWIYPAYAAESLQSGNITGYLASESRLFQHIAGWGPLGYLSAALCWTWCFIRLKTWWRWLNWISVITWSLFAILIVLVFLPEEIKQTKAINLGISIGNGLAFVFLMIWFFGVFWAVRIKNRQTY